jgi:gliding motility-associated lipoprotein GldD
MSESFRKMVYEHSFKSSAIMEKVWEDRDNNVFGLAYEIKGNTACNFAFTITDSSKHFFVGQLLFQSKPNYDSLEPSIKYIIKDLEEMISSFRWLN